MRREVNREGWVTSGVVERVFWVWVFLRVGGSGFITVERTSPSVYLNFCFAGVVKLIFFFQ